jgi:GT2 family glycosyltransferase
VRTMKICTSVKFALPRMLLLNDERILMSCDSLHITVVIPVCDRVELLILSLRALERQRVKRFEVIVVDNGSTPPIDRFALDQTTSYPLQVLSLPDRHARASARNLGIEVAQGDLVLFLDADILAPPDLLYHHIRAHRRYGKKCVVVGRRLHLSHENISLLAPITYPDMEDFAVLERVAVDDHRDTYLRSIDWDLDKSDGPWRAAFTCNLSMSRDLVHSCGAFDVEFDGAYGYEDVDLAYRLYTGGARFILQREAYAFHIDHQPLSGMEYENEKLRNLELFRTKHPGVGMQW